MTNYWLPIAHVLKRWRKIFLALLFILAMAMPSLILNITTSQPVVAQVQPGKASYSAGNFEQAASELQAAAANFATKGDKISQAIALRNLSLVYQQLGQWESANRAIADSLTILKAQPPSNTNLKRLAEALDVQGRLLRETGRLADAGEIWQQATKLYTQIGDAPGIRTSRINTAAVLQELGFYPKACNTIKEALGLYPLEQRFQQDKCSLNKAELETLKNLPVSSVNILGLRSLGNLLHALGDLEQSKSVLQQSLAAARELNSPQDIAATQLSLGNLARAQAIKNANKPSLAAKFREEAFNTYQAARESPKPFQQIQAQINQLSLLVESGKTAEARSLWATLQQPLLGLHSTRESIYARVNAAQSILKLAEVPSGEVAYSTLEEILKQAMQQAKTLGNAKLSAYVLGSLGKLYEIETLWAQAETFTTKALNFAPAIETPEIAYQLYWQLGRIQKAQGNLEKAIGNYSLAVNTVASLRRDLVAIDTDVQFSFRESVEPVYRELVSLLLARSENQLENKEIKPSQENLKLARQTIESLQLAELDNFFQDACATAKPKVIDEIDPFAAVLYPIILRDRLEVILSIPGEPLRNYTTEKSQTELEQIFRQTRISLRRTAFAQERLPLAQQLYNWLIRPAEAQLHKNNIKTLVFVLDGALRNLPMAVLHDGQQYLIQKYNIALTPGLQLLEPRPLIKRELRVLTGALSEARQGFGALTGTVAEVQKISTELPTKVLLNQEFTRSNIQDKIKNLPFPIVHLATHGQFSSNANETFIVAWDSRINVKQLDQILRVRVRGQTPIELFVLSACSTAAGDNRAALGLAGVAIRSGARSTIGSLWQVNDESTAIFMNEFYQELGKANATKASALRKAQLALLAQPDYQSPYFWAPFVLVGNWQ